MASSGVTTFVITGDEIIQLAMLDIGATAVGEEPSANEYTDARKRLNLLLKSLQTRLKLVTRTAEETFSTVADTMSYAVVSGTDEIQDVWIEYSGAIVGLDLFPNEAMIDSDVTGFPTGCFIDKSVSPFNISFYPVPDDVYEVHYRRVKLIDTLTSGTEEISIPVKAVDMLIKGLAYRLAPSYRLPLQERLILKTEYDELLREVVADNTLRSGEEIVAPLFVV